LQKKSNIVLIGMPGAGKSTVGVILAKMTARDFVDTDVLIQLKTGRPLQEIVDRDGYMALRRIEEDVLVALSCRNHVIATGGSAAYSSPAMEHLGRDGVIVFLEADVEVLCSRIRDLDTRGLAKRPDQSFDDLFEERTGLYRRYADFTVNCSRLSQEDTCREIIRMIDRAVA